jgi:hypothetical protein
MNIERLKSFLPTIKEIMIYGIIIILVISVFLVWNIYFRLDESKLNSLATKIAENDEINQYISFSSFNKDEEAEVMKYKENTIYAYDLLGSFNKEFEAMSDKEKYDVIIKVKQKIEEGGSNLIECGRNKYCNIDSIQIFARGDSSETYRTNMYKFELFNDNLTHQYTNENDKFITESVDTNNSSSTSTSVSDKPNLEIVEKSGEIDGDYIYVTGAVKNNSDNPYTYVEVKVTYFNDSGNVLDTDTTYVNSSDTLLPNERKGFEVMTQMIGEKYTKYKVEVLDFNEGY